MVYFPKQKPLKKVFYLSQQFLVQGEKFVLFANA